MLQAPVNLDLGCIVIIFKMNLEVKLNLKVHRFIIVFEPHHYSSWLPRTLKGKAVVGTAPTRHLPVRIQPDFRGETNHNLSSGHECLVSALLLIGREVHLAFESTALKEFWDSWAFGPAELTNTSNLHGTIPTQLLVMQVCLLHCFGCFGCTDSTVAH